MSRAAEPFILTLDISEVFCYVVLCYNLYCSEGCRFTTKQYSSYLNDDNIYYAERYYRFNDRIYAAFVTGDNWYDEYNGSELLLVMLDADSNEVLYAEKYHSPNYYMGAATYVIAMYRGAQMGACMIHLLKNNSKKRKKQ